MPSPNPPSRVASVHSTSTSTRPRETGNYSSRCAENDLRAGQKAFGADRYHEALFYFDRATSGDEANAEAWYRKGNCLHVLKRNLEAARCYDRALELDPTRTAAWNNKGIVLTGLGRTGSAIRCYDRALAIDPADATAWFNKGSCLHALLRFEDALACYAQAARLAPSDAEAWVHRGFACSGWGEWRNRSPATNEPSSSRQEILKLG
jgi:tetratricopeptide (TPR) repeat protein